MLDRLRVWFNIQGIKLNYPCVVKLLSYSWVQMSFYGCIVELIFFFINKFVEYDLLYIYIYIYSWIDLILLNKFIKYDLLSWLFF
jgi:hypothetical protein